jgi:hypothetical protein
MFIASVSDCSDPDRAFLAIAASFSLTNGIRYLSSAIFHGNRDTSVNGAFSASVDYGQTLFLCITNLLLT